jgi:hypothetical protein
MNFYQNFRKSPKIIRKFYKTRNLLNNKTVGFSITRTGFVRDDMFCAVCAPTLAIYMCVCKLHLAHGMVLSF